MHVAMMPCEGAMLCSASSMARKRSADCSLAFEPSFRLTVGPGAFARPPTARTQPLPLPLAVSANHTHRPSRSPVAVKKHTLSARRRVRLELRPKDPRDRGTEG